MQNIDVLKLTNAVFRRVYGESYLDLVDACRRMYWDIFTITWDRPRKEKSKRDALRLLLEKLNLKRFVDVLHEQAWDVVINTHFLPAEIIASLRRAGKTKIPQITATTDFETHRLWVNQPCERYCTATEEGAEYLAHWGVPRETVTVTGIPIHPLFSQPRARGKAVEDLELAGDRPVVLQLAGGFGVGPIGKIFRGYWRLKSRCRWWW